MWKWIGLILAVGLGCSAIYVGIGRLAETPDQPATPATEKPYNRFDAANEAPRDPDSPESFSEKIKRECTKEFGTQGTEAVDRCRLAVSTRYLMEHQQDQINSVYDRVQ